MAAWRMAIGSVRSEDLPDMAADALVRGLDSPALRMLAGQPRDAVRDSADLFRAALEELGIDLPDADTAHWLLARQTATDIVEGLTAPANGASHLWTVYESVQDSGDLRIFVGLASLLEDHPEDAEAIELQIVQEAQALLERRAPRIWIKLMATQGSSALTRTWGPDNIEVDRDDLQLSSQLLTDLAAWEQAFTDTLAHWPSSGGFASVHAAEAFVAEGQSLVTRLQHELGSSHHVEYMPEPIRPPGVKLRASSGPVRRLLRHIGR